MINQIGEVKNILEPAQMLSLLGDAHQGDILAITWKNSKQNDLEPVILVGYMGREGRLMNWGQVIAPDSESYYLGFEPDWRKKASSDDKQELASSLLDALQNFILKFSDRLEIQTPIKLDDFVESDLSINFHEDGFLVISTEQASRWTGGEYRRLRVLPLLKNMENS